MYPSLDFIHFSCSRSGEDDHIQSFPLESNLVSKDSHVVTRAKAVAPFPAGPSYMSGFLTGSPVVPVRTGEYFDQIFSYNIFPHLQTESWGFPIQSQKEWLTLNMRNTVSLKVQMEADLPISTAGLQGQIGVNDLS